MNYRYPQMRILIMARAPIPGQAKTRLIPALGDAGAAALHQQLLLRLLNELQAAALAPLQLWCSPDQQHAFFQDCARRYALNLHDQQGADLGARMAHALDTALQEAEAAMVIGCDIPAMDGAYLARACAALADGAQAVLGPSEDGGYTLLGLRQPAPSLFQQMPWGSAQVLAKTRAALASLAWQWQELDTLWDVDRPEDLPRLQALLAAE
jgi:rSAM/selenodomain-associated transferase 1